VRVGIIADIHANVVALAASSLGRGRPGLLAPLLEGYRTTPPLLAETFAWMILFYLQKNLALPNSPFTQHLLPIVAELDKIDDADRFMERHMGRA